MAATPTAVRGLSGDELARIRESLATGRKPRVVFTDAAGQIAGQVGQVVRLADPAVSDEWVVVRFGRDELPFAPTDLAVPPRGGVASAPKVAAQKTAEKTAPKKVQQAVPDGPPLAPREPVAPAARRTPPALTVTAPPPVAVAVPAVEKKPARKPKPPPSLTVTLAYADGQWQVSAAHGTRTVARPQPVRPADALKMVALLDVPAVRDAVEDIVAASRAEAERQAERLRAELAAVESRLADLRKLG